VLWTQLADGEVAIAAVNAVIGNVVGAVLTPITASLLIGADAGTKPTVQSMVVKPFELVIGPMALGVLLQLSIRSVSTSAFERLVPLAKHGLEIVMIVITYFLFCSAFDGGTHGLNAQTLIGMLAWTAIVHLSYLSLAWCLALKLGLRRRIAFVITACQKTDAMAVPIMQNIFPDEWGVFMLPIVGYHSIQMITAASMCGPLKRLVERTESAMDASPEEANALTAVQGSEDKL